MPHKRPAEFRAGNPSQSNFHLGLAGFTQRNVAGSERTCNRTQTGIEICGKKLHHVPWRRSERTGARECRQVPVRDNGIDFVVPRRQSRAQGRRESDARVGHAKRSDDALDELLVALSGAQSENVSKQSHAQVGVFELFADVTLQLIA